MAGTYVRSVYHCIWSTKQRQNWLTDERQDRIWSYMGGIAKRNDIDPIAIGGRPDHVHLLLSLPPEMTVSKAVQLIKGGSSRWMSEEMPNLSSFRWQTGYAAFSVSRSREEEVITYINHQDEHHRTSSFRDEYTQFLDRNDISYDRSYVFD